jgi:hypothetical protein
MSYPNNLITETVTIAAEQAEQAKTLAQAVLNQQRNFDRGNPGNNGRGSE